MATLAGLSLGVALYSYTTARLLIVILVTVLWAAYLGQWRRRWRPLLATRLIALAAYLPMALWNLRHPGKLTARFDSVSIFCRPVASCSAFPGITGNTDDGRFFPLVVVERLVRVYASNWRPSFLFYTGDPYGRHVTGHGGMLFVTLIPFLVVGAVAVGRRWREPFWRLIGLGTLAAGIPAALTMQFEHALRTIDLVPFLIVIMALGAAELIRQRWIAGALSVAILVEMSAFMADYFTAYPTRQASWFDPGLETAIDTAQRTPHRGPIAISDHIDRATIMFAFFAREDPEVYRAQGTAGGGATIGQVADKRLAPGTVVVAKPDEWVLSADILQTIAGAGGDGWGHPAKTDNYYRVWLVR